MFAQLGGLEIILEIGIPTIRAVTQELTEDLIERAVAAGFSPRVAESLNLSISSFIEASFSI